MKKKEAVKLIAKHTPDIVDFLEGHSIEEIAEIMEKIKKEKAVK